MIADLRRALPLLRLRPGGFALSVLFGSLGLGSAIALSAVAAWLIARASQMPPVLSLTVAAVAVRTFGVSRPVLRYLERLASHQVALEGMAALRVQLYRIISRGKVSALAGVRRGDLQARVSTDVEQLANVVVLTLLPAAVAAVVGIGVVVFLAFLSPLIALIVALCQIAAGLIGPYLTMRAARISEIERRQSEVELGADALSALADATELQVSGRLDEVLQRIKGHEAALTRASDRAALPAALGFGFDTLALGIAVIGAILVGISEVATGALTEVELAVVVLTPLAAFEGISLLGPAAVQLVRSAAAASRILALLDTAAGEPVTAPLGDDVDPTPGARPPATREGAHLRLTGASLAWPDHPIIARDIDLDVPEGAAIAVVGPSGVGKTTLLATLAGYIPPADGELSLDSRPAERERLAETVAVTAEDAHIFHASLLENLRVGNGQLTPADARELLERAGLGPWLASLPEGLETMMGSDGHTVSGGERRRILLARALGSGAPILLMDETAEHLDGDTADRLVADLLASARSAGRSVVLVTHRLSALAGADEVIMLGRAGSDARILDRGSHEHLLDTNEHYRWLLAQEQEQA